MNHRWTEADVARLTGQKGMRQTQETHTGARQRQPCNRHLGTVLSGVRQTNTGYVMTYNDWLPKISGHQLNRYARSRLAKRGRLVFGVLPPCLYRQQRARVEVIRVLGPRQKPLDRDSLAQWLAGLIDSLQPSYLWNDSEKWADIRYTNDGGRREQGPYIEIILTYEEQKA
jgi:hypothetical protein